MQYFLFSSRILNLSIPSFNVTTVNIPTSLTHRTPDTTHHSPRTAPPKPLPLLHPPRCPTSRPSHQHTRPCHQHSRDRTSHPYLQSSTTSPPSQPASNHPPRPREPVQQPHTHAHRPRPRPKHQHTLLLIQNPTPPPWASSWGPARTTNGLPTSLLSSPRPGWATNGNICMHRPSHSHPIPSPDHHSASPNKCRTPQACLRVW